METSLEKKKMELIEWLASLKDVVIIDRLWRLRKKASRANIISQSEQSSAERDLGGTGSSEDKDILDEPWQKLKDSVNEFTPDFMIERAQPEHQTRELFD